MFCLYRLSGCRWRINTLHCLWMGTVMLTKFDHF